MHEPVSLVAISNDMYLNTTNIFEKLKYPNIGIVNRAYALILSFESPESEEVIAIKNQVNSYNIYLEKIESVEGFSKYFLENNCFVIKQDVENKWTKEIAEEIFSLKDYKFETNLVVHGDYLFDAHRILSYYVEIEGEKLNFTISPSDSGYPFTFGKKRLLWNWWTDDYRDFTFYLWNIFNDNKLLQGISNYEDESIKNYNYMYYDENRNIIETLDVNMLRCLEILVSTRYMIIYKIQPDVASPWWTYRGKRNGTIDLAVLDMSFLKNKMLIERLKLILALPDTDVASKKYFLINSQGTQYLSTEPGLFGGHDRLKIYGKLDCFSAVNQIKKGAYVKHRVFFSDEETAIAAGYRPCGKCMKKQYDIWKLAKMAK